MRKLTVKEGLAKIQQILMQIDQKSYMNDSGELKTLSSLNQFLNRQVTK